MFNVHMVLVILHKSEHCGFCMLKVVGWSWRILEGHKSHEACYALQFQVYCRARLLGFRNRLWWHSLWYLSAIRAVWFEIWPKPLYSKQNRKSSTPHGGLSLYDATKRKTRCVPCCLSACSTVLKYVSMYFSDGLVRGLNDAVIEVATQRNRWFLNELKSSGHH